MKALNYIKENYFLIIILALAAFLRFYKLDFQSIWVDEIHTLKESDPNSSFKDFFYVLDFREGMGYFYFLTIRLLHEIFGYSVYTARLYSAVLGVLSVYSIYYLGKLIYNKNVGLIAATLLTINTFAISYSQEARPYMLLMLAIIISFICLINFIKKANIKNAICYGLSTAFIVNSHFVGLSTIFSQYVLLLFVFLSIENRKKLQFINYCFLSLFITIVLSWNTKTIFLKLLGYKSGWLKLPGKDGFTLIFKEFTGNYELLTFVFSTLLIYYLVRLFNESDIIDNKETFKENKIVFSGIILFTWIFLPVLIPIIKSYTSEPMILHRYFIGIIPSLMILFAISIEMIKNKIFKTLVIITLISFSLIDIFLIKKYYSTITKSQLDKVATFIIKENTSKTKIISSMGWLMSYYFNEKNQLSTKEKTLNNWIDDMRKGVSSPSSFWYIDGNSNFFNLSNENKEYVNANFVVRNNYNAFDAWCVEFKSKHNESAFIELKRFQPSMFDGSGAMIFIENKTSKYPTINLDKGDYKLLIKGFSLPNTPINGENAHFNIVVNKAIIKSIYLNNIPDEKPNEINFHHDGGDFNLELIYDNDIAVGKLDRNAVINNISLVKK